MSMSSAITLAQLERAMKYVKAYHDGTGFIPLTPTSGTVVINGDLDADLTVNGNIEVTGTISGNAVASGTITYGDLTGTVTENAKISECDISVDTGTLTFADTLSISDGVFYTIGTVTNAESSITNIYSDLTIKTDSQNALYNEKSTLFIEENAKVCAISNYSNEGRGIYNYSSGADCTINGTLEVSATGTSGYGAYIGNNTVLTVNGALKANSDGSYGIYAYGTFIIKDIGVVTAISPNSYAVHTASGLAESSIIEISGKLIMTDSKYGLCVSQTEANNIITGEIIATNISNYGFSSTYNGNAIIESGARCEFNGGLYGVYLDSRKLTVNGTLIANGTGDTGIGIYKTTGSTGFTINSGGYVEATGTSSGIVIEHFTNNSYDYSVIIKGTLIATATGDNGVGLNFYESSTAVYNVFYIEDGGIVKATGNSCGVQNYLYASRSQVEGIFSIKSGGYLEANGGEYGIKTYAASGSSSSTVSSVFTIEKGAEVVATGSVYGLYNHANVTQEIDGTLKTTATNSSGYGFYENATSCTVGGIIYSYAEEEELAIGASSSSFTFVGTGKVYANDILYYDGSENESEPD